MPLFHLDDDRLTPIPTTRFADEGVLEREDLQRLLREQLGVVVEEAMLLTDEFGAWQGSRRRIDLLALDREARLVVVELKRSDDGGHLELQALRYAAMASTMTFEQAADAHAKYSGLSTPEAQEALLSFLGWDEPLHDRFGRDVRVVLVAADFSPEVTTTVLWLSGKGLDISCVRLRPHRHEDHLILDVQRIIPLPEAEDYLVQAKTKTLEAQRAPATRGGWWFVNVGESPTNGRCWEDCRRYGFMLAGGGPDWIRQIRHLRPGDAMFAYLSGHGYVGAGRVLAEAVPQKDFVPPGHAKRLLDLPIERAPKAASLDDPTRCDWCVAVEWLAAVDREQAHKLPWRRQTACRIGDPTLIQDLKHAFGLERRQADAS